MAPVDYSALITQALGALTTTVGLPIAALLLFAGGC